MNKTAKAIKCPGCKRLVKNVFEDPYDSANNISPFHSKRGDKEYDFKCPECGVIYIFTCEPATYDIDDKPLHLR